MSTIPPHVAGQYLRALSKHRYASHRWARHIGDGSISPHCRKVKKWDKVAVYWLRRMHANMQGMSPYLEDGKP